MASILVTGAAGQIGSELTLALRRRHDRDKVIAAYRSTRPSDAVLKSGPSVVVDVTQGTRVKQALEKYDIGTIYHLASILSATGEQKPQLTWNTNMSGLYNVLEAARERHSKVFWPSSLAVFGSDYPRLRTPQNSIMIPSTIYGASKVAGELLCNYYHLKYGVDVRSVRYPGIISSETPPGGGTTDYAVDIFYHAILKKRYTCFVRENTVLPMLYMPDAIRAAITLVETYEARIKCRMGYNLSGMSFSAGELAREIQKHIPDFRCTYEPDLRQKIADSWPISLDDSLAREEWGWHPEYDLETMTKDMLEKLGRRLRIKPAS